MEKWNLRKTLQALNWLLHSREGKNHLLKWNALKLLWNISEISPGLFRLSAQNHKLLAYNCVQRCRSSFFLLPIQPPRKSHVRTVRVNQTKFHICRSAQVIEFQFLQPRSLLKSRISNWACFVGVNWITSVNLLSDVIFTIRNFIIRSALAQKTLYGLKVNYEWIFFPKREIGGNMQHLANLAVSLCFLPQHRGRTFSGISVLTAASRIKLISGMSQKYF